ncbi:PLP-dependent aminotransferase family protein [Marinomonas piezotolerans]|uniref:PLP-dependent aminotransferase family protein n=1 Tax=Marinomonas piezotolerans TaxID=2213058 RepID=A0A370UD20_9GAMM|nr:PLP-dependent aminotransferase family protein [Marinomonas piezotolerans]RDL45690.1 PLP-dependent aminotransferase family protein [Marinomonas piezotolerans]
MAGFRYEALEAHLRQKIQTGRFKAGEKLPSVRTLCQQHTLSKATVIHALQRLETEQLVYAIPKSGYFVTQPSVHRHRPEKVSTPSLPTQVNVPELFRDIMSRSAAFDILPTEGGAPASKHLQTLNRMISRAARSQPEQKANYYDEPSGQQGLRQAIVELYRQRDTALDADNLCITAGCQHALFLALMATCQMGDTVAVESPAFYGVLQQIEQMGLDVIEISSDPTTGIDLNELEEKTKRYPIKACVVTPNFNTPTGSKMSTNDMKQLVSIAKTNSFYIIEDDIYGELRFRNELCAPLKAFDHDQRVILCGSFSKCLSRELRIGWISGGHLQQKIIQLKLITQLASPRATQQGLTEFITTGHFKRYISQQRQLLKNQRDEWLNEISANWGDLVRFSRPNGGLSCWVELPSHIDTQQSYKALIQEGIVLTPGALFSAQSLYKNHMRLSFSQPLTEHRRTALHLLFNTLLSAS